MKYNLNYAPEALKDLDDIWEYIHAELKNPIAAMNVVNRIIDVAERLADLPESGARLSSIVEIKSDYRFLVSGNYLVFYRVVPTDVFIDRVLYGRRDYLNILFGELSDSDES